MDGGLAMPMYASDYAHCPVEDCALRERCYRYFLHTEAKVRKDPYACYFKPERIGKDCEYFVNKDNY